MAFPKGPHKSEVCLKDDKLYSLTKDKETRIISLGEEKIKRWQSFVSEELGVVWNLKYSQCASTSLGRMRTTDTGCGTSW